jgi:hypothetical protein
MTQYRQQHQQQQHQHRSRSRPRCFLPQQKQTEVMLMLLCLLYCSACYSTFTLANTRTATTRNYASVLATATATATNNPMLTSMHNKSNANHQQIPSRYNRSSSPSLSFVQVPSFLKPKLKINNPNQYQYRPIISSPTSTTSISQPTSISPSRSIITLQTSSSYNNYSMYNNNNNHSMYSTNALFNRIISGRKSIHPKWRKKTRRAAIILGIPRTTQNTIDDDVDDDMEDLEDEDQDLDGNYPLLINYNQLNSGKFQKRGIHMEVDMDQSRMQSRQQQQQQGMKDLYSTLNSSTSLSSPSTSKSTNLYSDGSGVWSVSRGGADASSSSISDDCQNSKAQQQQKKEQKRQPQIEYHFKPVPPLTSTIVQSMNLNNGRNRDNDGNDSGDNHDDSNYDRKRNRNNNSNINSNINSNNNHIGRKRFKRPKLKILRYSQHHHTQPEENEEDGITTTDSKKANIDAEKSSSSSSLATSSLFSSKQFKRPSLYQNSMNSKNNNHQHQHQQRNQRNQRKILTEEEQRKAKLQWAAKYTSLPTIRQTFGRNRNKLWGDFDSQTTRKLYHTLLPRALLGLYDIGLWSPKELAPLAYEARVTAKKYARERCVFPSRVMAMVFDGYRMWRDWGTFSVEGMSWEQVWDKYETQVLKEMMEDCDQDDGGQDDENLLLRRDSDGCCIIDLNEISVREEITAQICLRILERSCVTNGMVDKLFLEEDDDSDTSSGTHSASNHEGKKNSGTNHFDNDLNGKRRKRKRRRRRRNAERDIARIRVHLENDIQELLQANQNHQHSHDGSTETVKSIENNNEGFLTKISTSSRSISLPTKNSNDIQATNVVDMTTTDIESSDSNTRKVLTSKQIFFLRHFVSGKKKFQLLTDYML